MNTKNGDEFIGDNLRIVFTDRTGDIMGSFNTRPSQYLNVDNIHKNPIVLKYIREKKINTILD